jgi:hypothetical protein
VTDVISVPSDAFENTTTKTTIVIFRNEGNITENINFWELDVKTFPDINIKYDEKVGTVIKNLKGGVESVGKKLLCTASYKQLCNVKITYNKKGEPAYEMDYSLNYKDYEKQTVDCPNGYLLKRVDEICEIIDGYAFKKTDFKNQGIPLVQISNINNNAIKFTDNDKYVDQNDKYDKYLVLKGDIIIGMTGNIQEKIAINYNNDYRYLNQRVCGLRNFENIMMQTYFYSYWIYNKLGQYFQNLADGSVQKNLSKQNLLNYQLLVPNNINLIKPQLDELYELHQRIGQISQAIPELEKNICKIIGKLAIGDNYDEYKLGDVIIMKAGQFNTKDMTNTGEYPFYNASVNNPIGTINKYCFDDNKYILFIKSGGNSKNKIHACNRDIPQDGWKICILVSDDMTPRVHGFDDIIINDMNNYFSNLDGALNYNCGGHAYPHVMVLSVIGNPYYKRFNYIYHPDYTSLFCDEEQTVVAKSLNKIVDINNKIITHDWIDIQDNLRQHTEKFYQSDKTIFESRKKRGFPI